MSFKILYFGYSEIAYLQADLHLLFLKSNCKILKPFCTSASDMNGFRLQHFDGMMLPTYIYNPPWFSCRLRWSPQRARWVWTWSRWSWRCSGTSCRCCRPRPRTRWGWAWSCCPPAWWWSPHLRGKGGVQLSARERPPASVTILTTCQG